MTSRKLLTAIAAAALYAAVLVATAEAEIHSVRVTLVTGAVMVVQVDVAPGSTATAADISGLPAPIKSVQDLGPVSTPTPAPTAPPVNTPDLPDVPAVPGTGGDGGSGGSGGGGNGGSNGGGGDAGGPVPTVDTPVTGDGKNRKGGGNTETAVGEIPARVREKTRRRSGGTQRGDGKPTLDNPTVSLATPGPARIGVPNFFIDKFRIPPFLLPIYQAAGMEYGVRWEVLAAINEIETDYGRNLNVSSAGALGWMQFMPSTWRAYGVDANGDKVADPYNPVDAIFAAARYLRAAGAEQDIRRAVFAYNHADWYVDSVMMRAQVIGGLPSNLVGSLTGLTQGRFPVDAKATYAGKLEKSKRKVRSGNAAMLVQSDSDRRGIEIFSKRGAPVVAVNDGRIVKTGRSKRLGRYVVLQDVYGNTYTYARLGSVAKRFPAPKRQEVTQDEIARELQLPKPDVKPNRAASETERPAAKAPGRRTVERATKSGRKVTPRAPEAPTKQRLFAHPERPNAAAAGGDQQEFQLTGKIDGRETMRSYFRRVFGLDRDQITLKRLKPGARVVSGTILGRVGRTTRLAPHLLFEIRPAGRGAPRIDPKPILDGWKLLESTAIYRAAGKNPFFGRDAATPSIGQILLMSKEALVRRVLVNPRIQVYDCGRRDVRAGQIDRRVLATLEFLAASGLKPTVTSLKCGHGFYTASGNVSEHSSGNAVDIAAINGIPIIGHQGKGSITEMTIQRLLTLQGTMEPHQIISLMTFEGADNTYSMPDHADHIHVGFQPQFGTNSQLAKQVNAVLKPKQWIKLIDRLGEIENPKVRQTPSKFATHASTAHVGE